MTKLKIILVLFLSTSFLGIFGCLDCEPALPYQEINGLNSRLYTSSYELIGMNTNLDSLVIYLDFDIGYLASQSGFRFINSSYAWSCDESGDLGVKDKIVDISYYSTVDYLGNVAGDDIELRNSLDLPKSELIETLNEYLSGYALFLDMKQIGYFDLFVAIELESGEVQTFELISFEWE